MSTNQPPRRRRIAGERRRPQSRPAGEVDPTPTPAPPPPPTPAAGAPASGDAATAEPGRGSRLSGLTSWRPRGRRTSGATAVQRPTESRAPGWWGSPQSVVGLVVALVVLLALVVLGALGLLGNTGVSDVQQAEDAEAAAEAAPSVAERAAEAILAYRYDNIDGDQATAQQWMTRSFAKKYASTFEKTVKPAARTYRAEVTSEVKSSSVIRASEDEVRVLLFVDQTSRSTAHDRPQVALNRVELDMVDQDGDWLVDDISSY